MSRSEAQVRSAAASYMARCQYDHWLTHGGSKALGNLLTLQRMAAKAHARQMAVA